MAAKKWLRTLLLLALVAMAVAHGGGGGGADDDDDGGEDVVTRSQLRARPLVLTKVWCLIIAFVATMAAGLSPYFLRWHAAFLSLGTQFAGGVFLSTAFIHFLSDANETFRARLRHRSGTVADYPFAFMLACAGYLLTLLGDSVIATVSQRAAVPTADADPEHAAAPHAAAAGGVEENEQRRQQQQQDGNKTTVALVMAAATARSEGGASLGDSLLLILALCFHSVFEGIAIGVSGTQADAWRNLWTICLHKLFAAIAMGIALLKMRPRRPLLSTALYAFAFAVSTPIGIAAGIIIDATTQGVTADWIYAFSMAIATGVFVYVAVHHLLTPSSSNHSSSGSKQPSSPNAAEAPFLRFFAVAAGVAVIAVVMIWD